MNICWHSWMLCLFVMYTKNLNSLNLLRWEWKYHQYSGFIYYIVYLLFLLPVWHKIPLSKDILVIPILVNNIFVIILIWNSNIISIQWTVTTLCAHEKMNPHAKLWGFLWKYQAILPLGWDMVSPVKSRPILGLLKSNAL